MAVFNASEIEKYGGNGGAGFFSLKNDRDTARVRFMYNSIDDVQGYSVHQVEVNGKNRWVNCLREIGDPVTSCPFCREKKFTAARLFIPLYDIDEEKVKIWERGKKFNPVLSGLFARIKGDVVSTVFEIERHGAAGSKDTTYGVYPIEKDDVTLEDLDEIPEILGGILLDKSADDMEYYLEAGEFPPTDNESAEEEPIRRRSSREPEEERRPVRRTPATNRRGNGDTF